MSKSSGSGSRGHGSISRSPLPLRSPRPIAAATRTASAHRRSFHRPRAGRNVSWVHCRASLRGMGEHLTLELCGVQLRVSNPSKLYFPEPGFTKLDLINYYIECEQAVVRASARAPHRDEALGGGRAGQALLSEARARAARREWLQTAVVTFPSGRHARELVAQRRRAPRVGGQPRGDRLEPLAGAPRRPRSPRRAAHRPRPCSPTSPSRRCAR